MVTHDDNETRPLAVITGASTGIGYSLAKIFAMNGYDLVVCAEEREIHESANAFRALGGEVESVQADLAKFEGIEKLYGALRRPVDVLVLNAGVGVGGYFHETDLQKEIDLINLNITSTVHLAKRVLQEMLIHGSGKILFTSSIAEGQRNHGDLAPAGRDRYRVLRARRHARHEGRPREKRWILPETVGAKLQGSSTKPLPEEGR